MKIINKLKKWYNSDKADRVAEVLGGLTGISLVIAVLVSIYFEKPTEKTLLNNELRSLNDSIRILKLQKEIQIKRDSIILLNAKN